jgi:hypothetical protein
MRIADSSCSASVVILKIDVEDFTFGGVNSKGQAPITGDVQAPYTLPISFEHVGVPD